MSFKDTAPINAVVSSKIRNMGVLCAFLVVLIHCRPAYDCGTFGWWVKEILENGLAHIAVPFFFVVSGYMLARDLQRGYKQVVTKRAWSLLLPFVIWNALYWLFISFVRNISNLINGQEIQCWLPSISQIGLWYTGCPLLSPLWYIRALFVLVCIAPILLYCIRKFSYAFLLLLFIIYGYLCPFAPLPVWTDLENFARVGILPVLGLFYFSLGMAIFEGKFKRSSYDRMGTPIVYAVISLVVGLLLVFIRAIFVYMNIPYAYYLGFLCIPFILYGIWGFILDRELPRWLVTSSFGVYLIHKFVLFFVSRVIDVNSGALAYFCCAIIAFLVSIMGVVLLRICMPKVARLMLGGR